MKWLLILMLLVTSTDLSFCSGDSINQDWYGQTIEKLAKQEYNISYSENLGNYQSPNRKNNLRFIYKNNGFTVKPRVIETWGKDKTDPIIKKEKIKITDDWHAEFKVLGYGRNGEIENKFTGNSLIVKENTACIYDYNMKIDYTNNENGMRQDFTIYTKPKIEKGLLTISIEITTRENLFIGADALVIKSKYAKEYMKYNSLNIWDANEKELRGWFKEIKNNVNEETKDIQIVVNDEDAVYPIFIDPLSTNANDYIYGNQAGSGFGFSCTTAGDVNGDGYGDIIIGAPYYDNGQIDEGAAFVFYGSTSGISSAINEDWFAENNLASTNFGASVSTAGDVNGDGFSDIIVSAPKFGANDNGAVYLYLGSQNGPSLNADWFKSGLQSSGNFGSSISTAGDVNGDGFSDIVVGSSGYSSDNGAVFVYHGSNSGLSTITNWIFTSSWPNSKFGESVSTAGDANGDGFSDIIVGASGYENGQLSEGAAFVFYGSLNSLSSASFLTIEGNSDYQYLGCSVATSGDVNGDCYSDVIIGAKGYQIGINVIGAAFVHYGSNLGVSITANDNMYGTKNGSDFGISVSTAGDINGDGFADVIIGDNVFEDAYVYFGSINGLSVTHDWTDDGWPFNTPNSEYGKCVSTVGDINGDGYSDVIVSAPYYNDEGRLFIYNGSPDGLSPNSNWITESNNVDAKYGWSISTAGDVNGDGYSDVIIGAHYYDNGEPGEGAAFVYHGSSNGLSQTYNWIGEGNENFKYFGYSVSTSGDVNGDGYSDIIIGTLDPNNNESAYASVYYGSSSGLALTENWSKHYNNISYRINDIGVSIADDINGDGFSDVAIRLDRDSTSTDGTGNKKYLSTVYSYFGSASGLSQAENWKLLQDNLVSIYSASTAGDINGDGYTDIILVCKKLTTSFEYEVAIYEGSQVGLDNTPYWSKTVEIFGVLNISKVVGATAGDVNGDGFDDIILGVLNDFGDGFAQSYYGSVNGLSSDYDWEIRIDASQSTYNSYFGHSVASAGDVNGDGYCDVIVGAYGNDNDQTYSGTVFVYHGSNYGLSNSVNWSAEGNSADSDFGYSVASGGDVNGDGFSDIIVGAPNFTNGQTREGAAYIYYGSNGNYIDSRLRQNNPTTGNILASGNLTASNGEVQIGLRTKSPFGRADGRIVYEFRINGEPFSSGQTIVNSLGSDGETSFVDLNTNPNGKPILEYISGLNSEYSTAYQWRARKEFSLVNNPYQRYGPWKYFKAQFPLNSYAFRARVFIPLNIIAKIKVLLEGSYDEIDNMTTTINTGIPNASPYTEAPRTASSIPPNAVDWVLVELRDKNDNTKVLQSKSAFLLQDKTIRDVNGVNPLTFNLPANDYYIVVKHRNHLPIMSAEPIHLSAN